MNIKNLINNFSAQTTWRVIYEASFFFTLFHTSGLALLGVVAKPHKQYFFFLFFFLCSYCIIFFSFFFFLCSYCIIFIQESLQWTGNPHAKSLMRFQYNQKNQTLQNVFLNATCGCKHFFFLPYYWFESSQCHCTIDNIWTKPKNSFGLDS